MFRKKIKNSVMTFEEIWSIEFGVFKLIGISLGNALVGENCKPSLLHWFKFISGVSILNIFVFICINTLNDDRFDDIYHAAEVFSLILSVLLSIIKASALWIYQRNLLEIIKDFHNLWSYSETKLTSKNDLNSFMKRSKIMIKCYCYAIVSLGSSYALRPYFTILINYVKILFNASSHINNSITIFPIKYPLDSDAMYKYILLALYEQWVVYYGLIFWTACDILYIQLITNLILSDDIRSLNRFRNTEYNYNVQYFITRIVERHRYILSIFYKVNTLYRPIFTFTLLLNGVDLCCCIFTLDKEFSSGHWSKVGRSFAHASTLFIQIIIYCNYSHQATEMTLKLSDSIYGLKWEDYDVKLVKMLIMIMIRANKRFKFSAYGVVDLNRPHMTQIIKRTLGYLTLLRSFS
ncbi:GSCOCT00002058001.2-RA-CDS [Cotesia congregata]|uniref:Odorant receptor n=1 Tax=Cotesia congregata TaxID=51543 RepID=A0A8J2HSD7_COTCN|nr:GSCOCT00002058001.2-RA-CDS [Cotesia congregata]CAG5108971.1 olfactory receptor 32 [Cotesia congregata]